MIAALQISAVVVFAAVNVMVCSCLLLASRADDQLDKLRFTFKFESD